MKKILLLPACLLVMTILAQAQTKKLPPPPPPPAPPIIEVTKYVPPSAELKAFYQQHPDVEKLYWKSGRDIAVLHKDKMEYVYNMRIKEGKAAFKAKYGNQHISMPPPPPPPKSKTN
jgi:hypothetical protein